MLMFKGNTQLNYSHWNNTSGKSIRNCSKTHLYKASIFSQITAAILQGHNFVWFWISLCSAKYFINLLQCMKCLYSSTNVQTWLHRYRTKTKERNWQNEKEKKSWKQKKVTPTQKKKKPREDDWVLWIIISE